MRVFVVIRESLGRLGIHAPEAFEKFRKFNKRNICGLAVYLFCDISTVMSLICDAQTIAEYSDSIIAFSATFFINGMYINFIVNTQEIFNLVQRIENIIQKRRLIYFLILTLAHC